MASIFVHLIIGPLIILVGYLLKKYPPKKINYIYGYRTPMSMKNENTWKEGNEYSMEMMVKMGVLTTIFQVLMHVFFGLETSIMLSSIFLVVGLLLTVILTEIHLRKKFDKDGNWKDELV
ncbi:MAG: SdpI family protein [Bacteroidetes bacterium]|jgi:uncharacterized membrane protein|nr:SdpI family protein [Bacteroidota bacterium]MDF1867217.1 SdpI family protein [Saprospiraceae bacterium]